MRRIALAFGALLLVAACGSAAPTPAPAPTEAEAAAFITRLADLARTRDFSGLCALGSGNCERVLREVGEGSAPSDAPTILGTTVLESARGEGDQVLLGGRIMALCGVDGNDKPYRSEVLVFYDEGTLHAIEAVFWANQGIATDGTVGPGSDLLPEGGCPTP